MRHALLLAGMLVAGLMLGGCNNKANVQAEVPPPPPMSESWLMDNEVPPPPPPTGNILTPAPQPVVTPPAYVASAGQRTHVVAPGETLWRISGMYYSKASRDNVNKIVNANPGLNPDKIQAGQKIIIPD